MIVKYICSVCDKEFDNEEDCKNHEKLCGVKEEQLAFHCFDKDLRPLDNNDIEYCLNRCIYVYFDNKNAFDFFNEQQCYYYGSSAAINENLYIDGHMYYWDDIWVDLIRLSNKIDEILNKLYA